MKTLKSLRSSQKGFTLLEVVLVLSITIMIAVTVGKTFMDSSRAYSSLAVMVHSASRAQTILDRLEDELITAELMSIYPANPTKSNNIQFQKISAVVNGTPQFGNPRYLQVFAAETSSTDGLDNDNNGLTDEEGLRVWEDFPPYGAVPGVEDAPVVLTTKLVKDTLHFTQQGATLVIEMTMQEVVETGQPPKTFHIRSGVKVRN